jgi:hypothetical protein
MYNVTLRRFRETTISVRKQLVLLILSVLYCVLFVALVIRHARRMRRIVICSLYGCKIFFYVIPLTAPFSKRKKVTEHKMCVLIFCTTFI